MMIEYPTSQIAADRLRQIDASHQVKQQQPGVTPILDIGPFFDTRTGPIILIAAGPLSKSEARSLMSAVSYEADVTWNENTYVTKKTIWQIFYSMPSFSAESWWVWRWLRESRLEGCDYS